MSSAKNEDFNDVFKATFDVLDKMSEKERISFPQLFTEVSKKVTSKGTTLQNLVKLAVNQYNDVTVMRGRTGGVIKGKILTKKEQDTRPRCDCCGQVIRAKREPKVENGTPTETLEVSDKNDDSLEDELDEFLEEGEESKEDSDES